jgi:hypothetical protein
MREVGQQLKKGNFCNSGKPIGRGGGGKRDDLGMSGSGGKERVMNNFNPEM